MRRVASILLWPVLAVSCAFSADNDHFWKDITWQTLDGVKMVGLFHQASRPGTETWILLHGLGSTKEEWDQFARMMGKEGLGIFIYDARGHGASTHLMTGEVISYRSWGQGGPGSPWDSMASDLSGVVDSLHKKWQIPRERIAVGGASLGANVALVYASEHPQVPRILLLSPGMEYAGVQIESAFKAYKPRPLFLGVSPRDLYAYSSMRQMSQWRRDPDFIVAEGPGSEHGVNMFKDPAFTQKLLEWLKAWKSAS